MDEKDFAAVPDETSNTSYIAIDMITSEKSSRPLPSVSNASFLINRSYFI